MMRWKTDPGEIRWCTVDAIEVSPLRHFDETGDDDAVESCAPHEAEFWSVYTHFRIGGVESVADFDFEPEAWEYAEDVLALPRGLPVYSGAT